jgi:hypothetical protein
MVESTEITTRVEHRLLLGAALAISIGAAAQAQYTAPGAPFAALKLTPASLDSQVVSNLAPGMVVWDAAGAKVGIITHVGQRMPDGRPAVALSVDDKMVMVPASTLMVAEAGKGAISSVTKAEIKAGANP